MPRQPFEPLYACIALPVRLAGFYAHEALDALRRRRVPPADERVGTLSPRGRQCLTMLASGLRTARIAERMQVTPVTVEYHLRNARRKLGALTREEALASSIRRGLLEL